MALEERALPFFFQTIINSARLRCKLGLFVLLVQYLSNEVGIAD